MTISAQQKGVTEFSDAMKAELDKFRPIALNSPDSSFQNLDSLIQKATELKEYHGIAKAYNLIGIGYAYRNEIPSAIKYFLKSNEISEKIPPTDIWVDARNNIANMYITQGDTANALKYFQLGLEAAIAYGDPDKEILTRISMTSLEIERKNFVDARKNLDSITFKYEAIKGENVKAYYHIAFARYYIDNNELDSAFTHAETALRQYSTLNDLIGITTSSFYVGSIYLKKGKLAEAINFCKISYNVADTSALDIWQDQSCSCLSESYERLGDYKNALFYHKKLLELKENIRNDERTRDITRMEMEIDFAQQKIQDSLRSEQEKMELKNIQELEIQKEKSKNFILYGGLVFLGIISLLFFRSYKRKKADNEIIIQQKNTVEQKQAEIMDSIVYAKRLQEAILPSNNKIKDLFKETFILYKPKDIVSGDFYWAEKIDLNGTTKKMLAVADCTGHGVPGAMVSVVCSNALRRTVNESKIVEPGKILDQVSEIVIDSFENDINEIKDGMDISLISVESDSTGKSSLAFSGANHSIWIIRDTKKITSKIKFTSHDDLESGKTIIELNGNRQPVGKYLRKNSFVTHHFELENDDMVYLFSDGFHDQFGGANQNKNPKFSGKKLKISQFRKLILSYCKSPLQIQKEELNNYLMKWQGEFEQTDDICVIGLKF